MLFLGVDDPEKLKSIVNIKTALLEEATDFTFADFKEINRRLRGIEGIEIGLCFNPISHTHWIKKHFFDTPEVLAKTSKMLLY
jgi:phage terminase large subunit